LAGIAALDKKAAPVRVDGVDRALRERVVRQTVRRGGNRGRDDLDLTPQRHPDPGHGRVVDRSTGAEYRFRQQG